jgi:hypothetical protein
MNQTREEIIELIRQKAKAALGVIKPADEETRATKNFLFTAQRTEAGRSLPQYYLVYFLLVELLNFRNLGRSDKVSWSIPIDYKGEAFLIEYRKFGIGVFANNVAKKENDAREITRLINKGVRIAKPFYQLLADKAVEESALNVVNRSRSLFERFNFFLNDYKKEIAEITKKYEDKHKKNEKAANDIGPLLSALGKTRKSEWLALSVIDAFFSYTEHVFIHLCILAGNVLSGDEVAKLAGADWPDKYKKVLPVTDKNNKLFFDSLILLRRQLRNFVAHGAFGKEGEAFHFHSKTGAVPVIINSGRKKLFSIGEGLGFNDKAAIKIIEDFIIHLWNTEREPARLYLQDGDLPIILTLAKDGTYPRAMASLREMKELVDRLSYEFDRAANMDW